MRAGIDAFTGVNVELGAEVAKLGREVTDLVARGLNIVASEASASDDVPVSWFVHAHVVHRREVEPGIQRPRRTSPKLPIRLTLERGPRTGCRGWSCRCPRVKPCSSWKAALRPPPRSSMPLRPRRELLLLTLTTRSAEPVLTLSTVVLKRPQRVTVCANAGTATTDTSAANANFFIGCLY